MFESLPLLPADTILGLAAACRQDPNPQKVDLTVGIYMDEQGICPVFEAVRRAQQALVDEEISKAYIAPAGVEAFNQGLQRLILGEESAAIAAGRVGSVQREPCGAARVGTDQLHSGHKRSGGGDGVHETRGAHRTHG